MKTEDDVGGPSDAKRARAESESSLADISEDEGEIDDKKDDTGKIQFRLFP